MIWRNYNNSYNNSFRYKIGKGTRYINLISRAFPQERILSCFP